MQTVTWLHALSDETRLRLFRVLGRSSVPLSSPELVDILNKPLYTVSRAASELEKAGLVEEYKEGRVVFHRVVETPGVQELSSWVGRHCRCSPEDAERNADGSLTPGGSACLYDDQRLDWRLSLRSENKLQVTYGNSKVGDKTRVLFVCVHNSARSQLAEAYLKLYGGGEFEVESAGLSAGTLNPWIVDHLKGEGIDISEKVPVDVKSLYRQGKTYDWVITVCSREAEKNCPVFPGPVRRLNWPFPDPAGFQGSPEEMRAQVAVLAQDIKTQVLQFLQEKSKGGKYER